MASTQLSFTLRTSPNCKTVHLIGTWDGYKGQLPLSKDASKAGAWKGTFRFPQTTLKPGQRYWYYYIIDGYHVSHDPAKPFTAEPTTGRKLNILDVSASKAAAEPTSRAQSGKSSSKASAETKRSRRTSADVAQGRGLCPSKIVSPKPVKPNQTKHLRTEDFSRHATVEELSRQFASTRVADDSDYDSDDSSDIDSDVSSDVPSLRSSSSVSSNSSCCTCERYGITRKGDRVRLDCGGSRCNSDIDSDCSSDSEEECYRSTSTRRQGVVIRGSPVM